MNLSMLTSSTFAAYFLKMAAVLVVLSLFQYWPAIIAMAAYLHFVGCIDAFDFHGEFTFLQQAIYFNRILTQAGV